MAGPRQAGRVSAGHPVRVATPDSPEPRKARLVGGVDTHAATHRCGQQLDVMSLSSSPFVVVELEVDGVVVLEVVFFDVGELVLGFGSGGLIASKTIAWILA